MKKYVSSTTASTDASSRGVAVNALYGSLTSVLTTCTGLPVLSPPAARAMSCAALFAACIGLVILSSFGVSWVSSRGACRTHSPAGWANWLPSQNVAARPPTSTSSAPAKRGTHRRCNVRMIGLPTRAKNIASSTGRIRP